MKQAFSPALLARAYADPLAWLNLAVDLLPIWAVLQFGWGATPLVALYWLENLVIGVFTVLRMAGAGVAQVAEKGAAMLAGSLFLAAFFCVHYGAFCWGHGVFLSVFVDPQMGFPSPQKLLAWALGTGAHMPLFLGAIVAANLVFFLVDFIGRGEARRTSLEAEMAAPYGRIFTLHVAIILGAMFAFGAGDPLIGVFFLILIRVVFGVFLSVRRCLRRDRLQAEEMPA
ncbi:DUF6498-containing protein [Hyphomonas sp. WL0036]|uniref:DUF6498-containing protein n=1 Tax=Hyphomonas sediminis TaxID=2866160 RepID=UPI001C7E3F57|nr:DUF6498-containing protein [Hyphomonas sediminis]MBY9066574.1 DUF6498-containing protein [Hyphomonas sediminis]